MINALAAGLRRKAAPKLFAWTMTDLRPIVMSGPSGAGKSTLIKKLFQEYPNAFGFSVSHTTRKMRTGETDGKQYHFVSVENMKQEIDEGKFLEYTSFSGNYYGTSIAAVKQVLATQKICILDIDEQGVRNIKKSTIDAVFIFIKPPSMEELRRRLIKRGSETDESLERRMNTAASAIKLSEQPGVYDFVLENNELENAYVQLRDFLKQTCSSLVSKTNRYDPSSELPLAASVSKLLQLQAIKLEAGDSAKVKPNGFTEVELGPSIAEIPLSPSKTADHENPAVVNVTETPLLVMSEIPDPNESSESTSPAVVQLEESETAVSSDGVCGRQSWCAVS